MNEWISIEYWSSSHCVTTPLVFHNHFLSSCSAFLLTPFQLRNTQRMNYLFEDVDCRTGSIKRSGRYVSTEFVISHPFLELFHSKFWVSRGSQSLWKSCRIFFSLPNHMKRRRETSEWLTRQRWTRKKLQFEEHQQECDDDDPWWWFSKISSSCLSWVSTSAGSSLFLLGSLFSFWF